MEDGVDEKTQAYYQANAAELVSRYLRVDDGLAARLELAFPPGSRVLDVGAGSGRDLAYLLARGHDAMGVEPSVAMRSRAIEQNPSLKDRLVEGRLPELPLNLGGLFDGVLCSAVLMHLPREQLFDSAFALRSVLKAGGRLLLSVPLDRPGLGVDNRDEDGRLFSPINIGYLSLLFERLGFIVLSRWDTDDAMGRPEYRWCTVLFGLRDTGVSRPLDQIEGILNRDRKTATYKLALFRALADIAIVESERARWIDDTTVGIPIGAVSDRWLYYYWPIFESARFIPQIRGESERGLMPIAFRGELNALIGTYSGIGGLVVYANDDRSGRLSPFVRGLQAAALSKIQRTIVKGPVKYAGGSLDEGTVFDFEPTSGLITMNSGVWHELVLLGHWIRDAVILRWAELTAEFAGSPAGVRDFIDLLLDPKIPDRDVGEVRTVYGAMANKVCAWTGKPVGRTYAVDHIIPFSLWRNNSFWNLLPVLKAVNSQKRDLLPTRDLLLRRRDCIIDYWGELRVANQPRFDQEAGRLIGADVKPRSWQYDTFRQVAESVELTAIQWGSRRWEP